MATTHDLIDAYMARLEELAAQEDYIQRFFLFHDDELAELEQELCDSEQAREFYNRLLERFRAWRRDMGEEKWRQVIAHNDSLNGANQNGLLDQV